jgi:hypothetical protein
VQQEHHAEGLQGEPPEEAEAWRSAFAAAFTPPNPGTPEAHRGPGGTKGEAAAAVATQTEAEKIAARFAAAENKAAEQAAAPGVSFASAMPVQGPPPAARASPAAAASPKAALEQRQKELDREVDAAAQAGDFARANELSTELREVEAALANIGNEAIAKRAWLEDNCNQGVEEACDQLSFEDEAKAAWQAQQQGQ